MKVILIVLLLAFAVCFKDLSSIDDTQIGSLLSGDWQSLLPQQLQDVKDQLIKLLTPAPPAAPSHTMTAHRHYRLERTETKL